MGKLRSGIAELYGGSSTTNFLRIHYTDFHSACTVFTPVNCEIVALLSMKSYLQVLFFVFLILATCTGVRRKLKVVLISKKASIQVSGEEIVTHLGTM